MDVSGYLKEVERRAENMRRVRVGLSICTSGLILFAPIAAVNLWHSLPSWLLAAAAVVALGAAIIWARRWCHSVPIGSSQIGLMLDGELKTRGRVVSFSELERQNRDLGNSSTLELIESQLRRIDVDISPAQIIPYRLNPKEWAMLLLCVLLTIASLLLLLSPEALKTPSDPLVNLLRMQAENPNLPPQIRDTLEKIADEIEPQVQNKAQLESLVQQAEKEIAAAIKENQENKKEVQSSEQPVVEKAPDDSGVPPLPTATPPEANSPSSDSTSQQEPQQSEQSQGQQGSENNDHKSEQGEQDQEPQNSSSSNSQQQEGKPKEGSSAQDDDQAEQDQTGQAKDRQKSQSDKQSGQGTGEGQNQEGNSENKSSPNDDSKDSNGQESSPQSAPSQSELEKQDKEGQALQQAQQLMEQVKKEQGGDPKDAGEQDSQKPAETGKESEPPAPNEQGKSPQGKKQGGKDDESQGASPEQAESQQAPLPAPGQPDKQSEKQINDKQDGDAPNLEPDEQSEEAQKKDDSGRPAEQSSLPDRPGETQEFKDGDGKAWDGLQGDREFKDQRIEYNNEALDYRYTGSGVGKGEGDTTAPYLGTIVPRPLGRPDSITDSSKQPVPLEYRDVID